MKFSFNTQIDFSAGTFNIFFFGCTFYEFRFQSVVIHTDNVVEIIYLRHFRLIAWKKNSLRGPRMIGWKSKMSFVYILWHRLKVFLYPRLLSRFSKNLVFNCNIKELLDSEMNPCKLSTNCWRFRWNPSPFNLLHLYGGFILG